MKKGGASLLIFGPVSGKDFCSCSHLFLRFGDEIGGWKFDVAELDTLWQAVIGGGRLMKNMPIFSE